MNFIPNYPFVYCFFYPFVYSSNQRSKFTTELAGLEIRMSLDHGMLNLPLRQRGEINAQLDRYKHEQVVKARGERTAKAAETRDLKAQAKQALGEINAALGLIEAKAAALGVTRRALVSQLTEWSKWQPANLLKLHRLWIEQPK